MDFVGAGYFFYATHYFFKACPGVIGQFGGARRNILWQKAQVFQGLKHTSFFQVVVWESWFGATQTRVIGASLA